MSYIFAFTCYVNTLIQESFGLQSVTLSLAQPLTYRVSRLLSILISFFIAFIKTMDVSPTLTCAVYISKGFCSYLVFARFSLGGELVL